MTTEQVLDDETKAPSDDNSLRQALSLIGKCFAEQAKIARRKNKVNNQLKNK